MTGEVRSYPQHISGNYILWYDEYQTTRYSGFVSTAHGLEHRGPTQTCYERRL